MKKVIFCIVMAISVILTGCVGQNPNETGGTLLGAAAGGLLGSQFGSGSGKVAAALVGAAVGGYAGNRVGASMDRQDRMQYQQAVNSGRGGHWENERQHRRYRVVREKRRGNCEYFKITTINTQTGRKRVERVKKCRVREY